MKLIRAEFENFRLLIDLEINFSTDPKKNLTVIRAENETGKTTILHALQWALYGDLALPDKGRDFRLHPIDWDSSNQQRVPITVSVEFEIANVRRGSDGPVKTFRRYRIVRSAFEEINGKDWQRTQATMKLFNLSDQGATPISSPDAIINDELPLQLRDVFFTDGDRALSFIEADVTRSTKRERVQQAIRSLLGLDAIQDAIKHVQKSAAEINKQAKKIDGGSDLESIASRLERIDEDTQKLQEELDDAKEQFTAFDEKVNETDRKISAALQKGDKDKLRKNLEDAKRRLKQLDEQISGANKEHSALFRSRSLASDLLSNVFEQAFGKLDELHDLGKIPSTTVPILEERLTADLCICGENLSPNDSDGQRRRDHILKMIDDSRHADEIQEVVTDLYYGARALQPTAAADADNWLDTYKNVVEGRDRLQTLRDDVGRELRSLDLQLDQLGDTDIQGLRETRRNYLNQRDRFLQKRSTIETKLEGLLKDNDELSIERDRKLREKDKGALILSELHVTQDVIKVLKSSYERITNEELDKVSELMNVIFLEMIGSDLEQGAIIKKVEISKEFDIVVYGANERTLNPDRDLNGASRRALTLAFILALTKISEVEAPNVIDTPLGMMSGYVKQSVLRTAIRESSQLVLFLTHSEIAGCEEIIDEAAGVVFTLTNPAHYPKMLANDPGVDEQKILRCNCDHRSDCELCVRRLDEEPAPIKMVS